MVHAWWMFVGALTGILTGSTPIHGACVFEGSLYANNTSWRPQSCQECACHGDVAVCRRSHCPDPQCDSQRGERLRIPANKCCPECISSSPGSCQYEGVVYGHDSQWSPSPCSRCVCSRGSVSCSARPCPPLSCPGDQSPFVPAGECCPKCGREGGSCSWQATAYRDGEEWALSLCSRCVCSDGEVQCSVAECQQVACKPHENLVIQPGRCCPQCVSNPCLSAGNQHQHGEQWQKNACTTCVCDRGQSKCHTHTCRPVTCDKGQTKVKRAGQCCDGCAAAKGSCPYEDGVRYHGDMWNGTGCEFCTCNRGQVVCQRAECGRVECPQGSELVHLPGRCCPECSSQKPSCLHEGQSYKEEVCCVRCGIPPELMLHLWEVNQALWCTQCYLGQFPVGAASGLFCKGSTPYMPAMNVVDCMELEAKAKPVWTSAGRTPPEVLLYADGVYCPVYTKIWAYPDGIRVSSTHLTDGRFIVIGPRLPALQYPVPPPEEDNDTASITGVEHRDVGSQTMLAGVVPNLMGMWGYDEDCGELVEVIPEGLIVPSEEEDKAATSPVPTPASLSPDSILNQNVLALVLSLDEQMKDAIDDEEDDNALLEFQPPGLEGLVVLDSWQHESEPEDDVLIITAEDDDEFLEDYLGHGAAA